MDDLDMGSREGEPEGRSPSLHLGHPPLRPRRGGQGGEVRSFSKLKGWAGRLGLLLFSSLLAAFLAELICRQFVSVGSFRWAGDLGDAWSESDAELGYRLKSGWRGWLEAPEYRHRVEINSRGFRGPEPNGAKAVWMLGDSFVFGVGVEPEDSLPGLLEAELERKGRDLTVWNLGVPSWSGPQYRRELERRLAESRPEAVVVVFFLGERISGANDLIGSGDTRPKPAEERRPAGKKKTPAGERVKKWLARHSALYNAILNRFGPGLRGLVRHAEPSEQERRLIEEGWQKLDGELAALASLAEIRGFPLLAAAMPEQGDLAHGGEGVGPRFLELARQHSLPALDLSPVLRREPPLRIFYARDGHLRPRGNRLAAVAIADALPMKGPSG
jgi:hypothetical protein